MTHLTPPLCRKMIHPCIGHHTSTCYSIWPVYTRISVTDWDSASQHTAVSEGTTDSKILKPNHNFELIESPWTIWIWMEPQSISWRDLHHSL